MSSLLETYSIERNYCKIDEFQLLPLDYKKGIENSVGFKIYEAQNKFQTAYIELDKSFKEEIEKAPLLKKIILKIQYWRFKKLKIEFKFKIKASN